MNKAQMQQVIDTQALEIAALETKLKQQIARGNRKAQALQQVSTPQAAGSVTPRRAAMNAARAKAMSSGKTTAVTS